MTTTLLSRTPEAAHSDLRAGIHAMAPMMLAYLCLLYTSDAADE